MRNKVKTPFRGVLHIHSSYSFDGVMSYFELREFFLLRGLHFACMTEHIDKLTQDDIVRIIDDCRNNSDDKFIFVPGLEMDYFSVYFIGVKHGNFDFTNQYSLFTSLRRNAALCILAHPIKRSFKYPNWLLATCDGVEVLNCKYDGQHYFRPQSERIHWRLLKTNPSAIAVAGIDFHRPKDYSDIHFILNQKGEQSEGTIINSLKEGAYQILKGNEPITQYGFLKRMAAQLRISFMDFSHNVNRNMANMGVNLPKGLKERIRKNVEGGNDFT